MSGAVLPFIRHSVTSADAADAYQRSGNAMTSRARVLAAITAAGPRGATDKELQRALDMRGSTQRPRRVELVRTGQVEDSGQVRGRSVVWVVSRWAEVERGETGRLF
tara:strand:+ start:732 stop:1052 length:321 start_codon:yes stop_codon:yes gene_type:complete